MEQQQFQENVSEWIIAVNSILKELQEVIDNIGIVQEEDLMTLSYQYHIINDVFNILFLSIFIYNRQVFIY